jgi:hypothetical protein
MKKSNKGDISGISAFLAGVVCTSDQINAVKSLSLYAPLKRIFSHGLPEQTE